MLFPTITSDVSRRYLRGAGNAVRAQLVAATLLFTAQGRASPASAGTELRLLAAIRTVEGVKFPARPGLHGELGYFRLRETTWRQHTAEPFARCGRNPSLELTIALTHLRWLVSSLIAQGEVPTPYRLAVAWNAGLEGSTHPHHAPAAAYGYARRVVNLFAESEHSAP